METVDVAALLIGVVLAAVITAGLLVADRGENGRRAWIVAGGLAVALMALGFADIVRESPRETHLAAPVVGAALPVLGALGIVRGTRRVRMWLRSLTVFAAAIVLLFGGLLLGAAVLPRWLVF